MKYPLKAQWPVDSHGNLPSDEAYERFHRLIAKYQLRIQSEKRVNGA